MASVRILIRRDATDDELYALTANLDKIRGVHHVGVDHQTEWNNATRSSEPTGWSSLKVRGTDIAIKKSTVTILNSGIEEQDQNADHDHAACVASARKLGVPESWAHRPETYLSM